MTMNRLFQRMDRAEITLTAVFLICALITFCFAPGHMDADALGMLRWIRQGGTSDWYPLLLPAMLRAAVFVGVGPLGILGTQVFTLGICIYAFMAFFWRPLVALGCTCLVLLNPAVLGYLGAITSHAIMMASLILAFTAMLYLTNETRNNRRAICTFLSLVGFAMASISRQNSLAYTLPGVSVLLFILLCQTEYLRSHPALRAGLAGLGSLVIVASVWVSSNALLRRLLHPVHMEPAESLMLYDLAALSLKSNHLLIEPKYFPSQQLTDLKKLYRATDPNYLVFFGSDGIPPLTLNSIPAERTRLFQVLLKRITEYPEYYFEERYQIFGGLLGLNLELPEAVPFHPGIDTNNLGYQISNPTADHAVVAYLGEFSNSTLDRPFIYFILLFVSIGVFPLMPSKTSSVNLILPAMVIGTFLHAMFYFPVAPSTLLRYIWPSILSSMVVLAAVFPCVLGSVFKGANWATRRPLAAQDEGAMYVHIKHI